MLHGKLGENFAVEFDMLFFFERDETCVRETVLAECVVEADDPETSEGALLGAAVAMRVLAGFEYGFFGGAVVGLPTPVEAFRELEKILSSFVGDDAAFHSGHRDGF